MSQGSRLNKGGGFLLRVPAIDIAEVGAGGGSIVRVDGAGALHVGPRSAGAVPGPVCYDQGGTEVDPDRRQRDARLSAPRAPAERAAPRRGQGRAARSREQVAAPLGIDAARRRARRLPARLRAAWRARSARSPSSAAATRATSRWWPSAATGRSSRPRWRARSRSAPSSSRPRPACSARSACWRPRSSTTWSARSCARSSARSRRRSTAAVAELEREAAAAARAEGSRARRGDRRGRWTCSTPGQSFELTVPLPPACEPTRRSGRWPPRLRPRARAHLRPPGGGRSRSSIVNLRLTARVLRPRGPRGDPAPGGPRRPRAATGAPTSARRTGRSPPRSSRRAALGASAAAGPAAGRRVRRDHPGAAGLRGPPRRARQHRHHHRRPPHDRPPTVERPDPPRAGQERLDAIVDEMAIALVRTAYSNNLKNAMDMSCALCDVDGRLIAQGLTLPLHLGSIPDAMAQVRRKFGGEPRARRRVHPERPVRGRHPPARLLHLQAHLRGRRLVGWSASIGHQPDVGGKTPGGNGCDATEIFQEGLRIPPLKLYAAGKPVEALFELIERNVRVPRQVLGDVRSQVAACLTGERGYLEAGRAVRRRALRGLHHRAARPGRAPRPQRHHAPCRTGATRSPTGSTTTASTPTRSRSRWPSRSTGDRLIADFTGSAPQVKGAINSPLPVHQVRGLRVRAAPDRRRPAEQRGLLPPDRGDRAARHRRQPGHAGRGRGPRPDRLPDGQRGLRRAGPDRARPRLRVRDGRRHRA